MRLVVLTVALAACGSVSTKNPDGGGGSGHDATGGQHDAPVDVATDGTVATPITAIGAGNVTQFTATGNAITRIPYVPEYDDLSEWSTSTNKFTAKTAGDYLACASIYMGAANLNALIALALYKNGAQETTLSQAYGIASSCATVRLAANDTLDFEVINETGTTITVPQDPNWQWMSIERVTEVVAAATSGSFSSPSGQFVQIPYSAVTINDGSMYSANTHQLTAASAGDYQVCASIGLGMISLEGEIDVFINGTRERAISNGVSLASGCRSVRLAANDALDVRLFQNTTSTTIPSNVNPTNWLDIQKQPISVSVGAISSFSAATQTFAQVPYTTVLFDAASQFNAGTHTFTAASAGDYQICASLLIPQSTADGDEIDIYKNSVREKGLSYGHFGLSGCRVMRLATGDTVSIWSYSQGAKSFTNDVNWDWFEVSKLR